MTRDVLLLLTGISNVGKEPLCWDRSWDAYNEMMLSRCIGASLVNVEDTRELSSMASMARVILVCNWIMSGQVACLMLIGWTWKDILLMDFCGAGSISRDKGVQVFIIEACKATKCWNWKRGFVE
jgi:hypothetical protein